MGYAPHKAFHTLHDEELLPVTVYSGDLVVVNQVRE
jgi:hypothetical protein